ncbi:MAG TPA: M24 family metallopeptidase [Firmicutes bacterium]|jgi:Xaa-Pro aminopeptidase|nr:M24 family metallopeptidase [Bacillota bacterium]
MDRLAEIRAKHAAVAQYLADRNLDGVILARRENFAWLTAGGDNHVPRNEEHGATSLLVTPDEITAITTNIEAPRMEAEELCGTNIEVVSWPWYADAAEKSRELIAGRRFGSDNGVAGTPNISSSFAQLRWVLYPGELERCVALGKDTGVALEKAAMSLKPGMTEFEIAGMLAEELLSRGIEDTVNLIAVDERIERFRHPIPTNKVLNKQAMLVVCARRGGLIVAATRLVYFGRPPEQLKDKHQAVCRIEAAMYAATVPGKPMGDALAAGIDMYAKCGYGEEWKLHHQGGPIAYNNREFIVVPGMQTLVLENQPFAWNPSITGTKGEDTIITNSTGFSVVTAGSGQWPMVAVDIDGQNILRPDILVVE